MHECNSRPRHATLRPRQGRTVTASVTIFCDLAAFITFVYYLLNSNTVKFSRNTAKLTMTH